MCPGGRRHPVYPGCVNDSVAAFQLKKKQITLSESG